MRLLFFLLCIDVDTVLLAGLGLVWHIAQLIQGFAHLGVNVLREVEVGEGLVQYLHDLIDTLQGRLVVLVGRSECQSDHLLNAAHLLKVTVLLDDSQVLVLVEPITVATGNLRHELGIELRIVDGRQIVYLVDDQETVILSGSLLEGLDDDLNAFFENLMKE